GGANSGRCVTEARFALLVGATGLVGSYVLRRLLESSACARVAVWVRRDLGVTHAKLKVEVIEFERLSERRVEAHDVYCCLGTTIKQAGSQAAFRRVDHDYPVALARAAARDGAKRLLVVSALGANPDATAFYNRVKGEMEAAVRGAGVAKTYLFRPSLLSGPRQEQRLGERIGLVAGAVLGPLLGKFRPIHAELVAEAMLAVALQDPPSRTLESDEIRRVARRAASPSPTSSDSPQG
ncbi:MAG TPA: NAD(P)H-binding protein, partial [Lysobacter sp.]|nr:NAD(P)H-binding protein [Lysobacter sp.]